MGQYRHVTETPQKAPSQVSTLWMHDAQRMGGTAVGAVDSAPLARLLCCTERGFGADRRGNVLILLDCEGPTKSAYQQSLAVEWGLREAGPNPCRAVRKYRTRPRERSLTDAEYCRLGRALDLLEARGKVSRHAAAAIRLLVLTGCRRNEVLELRWDDLDRTAGKLRLRDGKTGARMVPLTPAVLGVMEGIPRVADNPWVIVGQKLGARLVNVGDPWLLVRAEAGLDGVRIHDLRHPCASYRSNALSLFSLFS